MSTSDVNQPPLQDPSTTFPRIDKELTTYYRHFSPYYDDVVQLKAAARLSSLKWAETAGEGISKEMYLLAVADKAMEILNYTVERDQYRDTYETRREWRKSLKKEVIPKAIAAAEKYKPLPIHRKEMVAFLLSALDANYASRIHAFDSGCGERSKHYFMSVVSRVELPIKKVEYVSGPAFEVMSSRVGSNIIKAQKALEHLNELHPSNVKPRRYLKHRF